jgi:Zn-dependent M28 family amino/carboxypeptidase
LTLLCSSLSGQSNERELRKHVRALSTITPTRSYNNTASLNQAADYIYTYFKQNTQDVFRQKFVVDGSIYQNVICSFGEKEAPRIIIGAHYDAVSQSPGADDNASGVASLLELSKLLSKISRQLNYRIDLVAYSLKEPPFFNSEKMGSYFHAKSLKENNINVLGMISLECLGYFSDKKNSQDAPYFGHKLRLGTRANFIASVRKRNNGRFPRTFNYLLNLYKGPLRLEKIKPIIPIESVNYSDHKNYWHFGYSAIMLTNTAFYRNENYHKSTDTWETLDYKKLTEVTNMLYKSLVYYKIHKSYEY